jgi:protocatechuate 3,4-dioxygenase beta subunit
VSENPAPNQQGYDPNRREVLSLLGAAGSAVVIATHLPGIVGDAVAAPLDCVVTPTQTEGPYFIDEKLLRNDIRSDPASGLAKPGMPLRLRFSVMRVDGTRCAPLNGAIIDLWQCDASGTYSDVRDFQGLFDTRGQKLLRGYQLTDASGAAEFLTLYPGWYAGRAVHIHFKVRVPSAAGRDRELTSQLYFDEAVTDRVHASAPYNQKGQRDTRNDADGIFRRADGSKLLVPLQETAQGFSGNVAVGLRLRA